MLRRYESPHSQREHKRQQQDADRHVQGVKSHQREIRCAEQIRVKRQPVLPDQFVPLESRGDEKATRPAVS